MSGEDIYRIAWRLLNEEFRPGDDTFKGISKDIHNACIAAGWAFRPSADDRVRPSRADVGVLTGRLLGRWTTVSVSGPGPNECTWIVRCAAEGADAKYGAPSAIEALTLAIEDMESRES